MSHHDQTIQHTRLFLENMVSFAMRSKEEGLAVSVDQVVGTTLGKILELAEQHFPLAKVLDESDLVLHAEGPGASNNMPWLSALNWVTSTAETNIKKLATAYFDLHGANGKSLSRKIDPRLTGIASGSLWVGVKIDPIPNLNMGINQGSGIDLSHELQLLPELIKYIDDEGLRMGFEDAYPDPALRDISLAALLRFAPTGRKGIHTMELATQQKGMAKLGQRERVVLKEAIDKPSMKASRTGSFVGQIREADLDKTRLHLRDVAGIGTLRCVVRELSIEAARILLGRHVRAVGNYQTDIQGRPRFLFVERFEEVPQGGVDAGFDL
jgi:hypothetical protein